MLQQWPLDICRIQYSYRNNDGVMLTSNQITPQIQYLYEPERYANLKLLHWSHGLKSLEQFPPLFDNLHYHHLEN